MTATSRPVNDQSAIQRRRLVQTIKAAQAALLLIFVVSLIGRQWVSAGLMLLGMLALQVARHLFRRRKYDLVAAFLLWSLTLTISVNLWVNYGLRDASLMAYPGVLIYAALIARRKTF